MERNEMDLNIRQASRTVAKRQETRAYYDDTELDFVEKRRVVYESVRFFVEVPEFENPSCATTDPELFFPEKGMWHLTKEAKKVCSTCPALDPCRVFALENRLNYGIWGGTTARERYELNRVVTNG